MNVPIRIGCRPTPPAPPSVGLASLADRVALMDLWLLDSYMADMSEHSVADARNNLSRLIDRALAGEGVTITRHGRPVVELRPVARVPRRLTRADIEWVVARRRARRSKVDAGTFVSQMRDEERR